MMDLHIIPECYIDTKLIKSLVPPIKSYNHQKGCSTVVNVMQEKFKSNFAIGIVDRDKRELKYAEKFTLVFEITSSLQLFKYENHYLIFICPAMEKWIIANADSAGLSLANYNLPHDFKELRSITKSSKSESDDIHSNDFKYLFRELKRANPLSIAVLKFWIEYLKSNPYSADVEYIKSNTEAILAMYQ